MVVLVAEADVDVFERVAGDEVDDPFVISEPLFVCEVSESVIQRRRLGINFRKRT